MTTTKPKLIYHLQEYLQVVEGVVIVLVPFHQPHAAHDNAGRQLADIAVWRRRRRRHHVIISTVTRFRLCAVANNMMTTMRTPSGEQSGARFVERAVG